MNKTKSGASTSVSAQTALILLGKVVKRSVIGLKTDFPFRKVNIFIGTFQVSKVDRLFLPSH